MACEMALPELKGEDLINVIKDRGKPSEYRMICDRFCNPETNDDVMREWLTYLRDNVCILDSDNEQFVAVLLRINWTKRSEEVIKVYSELILNLVSAYTHYLPAVLRSLINAFNVGVSTNEPYCISVKDDDEKIFEHVHQLLKNIVAIVPMASLALLRLLLEKFPYLKKSAYCQLCYVQNILAVTKYMPDRRQICLEIIINKMLDIDLHCPKVAIERMELEAECEESSVFPIELESQAEDTIKKETEMKHPFANTLDILMENLFCFIDNICLLNKTFNWDATKKLYKELLTLFDELILPTHASSHIQFIMFYVCSLKRPLFEGFIDYLWKKFQNPMSSVIIKQVSVCYIGSLLARAKYIPTGVVKNVLDIMTHWIHQYIEQVGNSQTYGDVAIHGTFYTVCQTVFYVFAFLHKELMEMEGGMKFLRRLNFDRIINCRLNPLKVCLPSVIKNFASVTKNYQLAYCYTIIEQNNRNLISDVMRLDTFFPFDPYILKFSGKRINPIYRLYELPKEDETDVMEEDEFTVESPTTIVPDLLLYEMLPA